MAVFNGNDSGNNSVYELDVWNDRNVGIAAGPDGAISENHDIGQPAAKLAEAEVAGDANGKIESQEEKKAKAKSKQPTVSFIRLFSFADKYDYFLMFFGSLAAVAHGLGIPTFLLYFGKVLNGLGSADIMLNGPKIINKYSLYFVWLGLITWGSAWIELAFWMLTGDRQSAKLRTKYLEALLRQDVAFFDTDTNTGQFVSSIASDPLIVQDAISEKMGNFLQFMGTFIGGSIVGFTIEWRIALLTLAVIPLIAALGGGFAYTVTRTAARASEASADAGNIAEQAIAQVRTVYSFVNETKFMNAYSTALDKTMKLGTRAGLAKGLGLGFTYAVIYPSFALLLWYGGVLVREGFINGGQALSAVFAVIVAGISLGQAMPILQFFAKGKVAAYTIFEMIDHDSKINVVDENVETLDVVEGHIELRNVDFAYPSRPDVFVFRNFSLVISAGRTVAIVGSSGSGKSTVVSLIERFYDPDAGEVLLDGHDIKKLDLKWLRGQTGLVNQEPALFATTIAANILYGKDNATQDEIEDAAKAANAHSFIEKQPLGYQTQVGERGIQLSGGQKQRVAIARAILRNPAVLLLDEATSALDAGSEQVVQEALDGLMVGRTTIVVAHRLSTIRNAESIAVVQQGQIIERGTHQQLISREGGAYSALVRLQESAATKDASSRRSTSGTANSGRLSRESRSFRSFSLIRGGSAKVSENFEADDKVVHTKSEESSSSQRRLSRKSRSFTSFSLIHGGSAKVSENFEAEDKVVHTKSEEGSKGSFTRLIAMSQPEWKHGIGGIVGSILAGFQNPSFAFMIGYVLTAYYEPDKKMESDVSTYAIALVVIGLWSLVVCVLQHYCLGVVGENLVERVRAKMFATILRNELGWFDRDENNSGQILARLNSDATNVRAAIGDRAAVILQNSTLIIVAWCICIVLQWKLSLVIISTTPLLVFSASLKKVFLKGFSGDRNKAYARATQVAGEAVTNIRTVAAFNAEHKVKALFAEELKGPAARSFLTGQISGFALGLAQCLMYCSYGLGLWYSGKLIANSVTSFGHVIKVFLILIMASSSMAETLALAPDLVKGGQAVKSVFEVLDRKTAIDPEDPDGEQAESIVGDIELKGVTFAYPSRPDVMIFKDLNLKLRSGRSLALVGASGSGKSSVIALIERFYDPVSGHILIDGKDIRKYNLKSLRQHIALVSQEPALFATSIYENILYGKDGASEAEVIEAAKAANAHQFISSLPDGYQTQVGERGVQLSGGQKQRVAIARAVLKDPAILLLDEATSALDAESEKIVQEALDRLLKGRTSVMIAHRLSTIRGANKIAVVHEGALLEEGSHGELIAKGGGYARLINLQNQQQESSNSAEISRA